MYVMIPDKVKVSGKVQLQTDIKKANRELKNELYLKQESITGSVRVRDRHMQKRRNIIKKKNTRNGL